MLNEKATPEVQRKLPAISPKPKQPFIADQIMERLVLPGDRRYRIRDYWSGQVEKSGQYEEHTKQSWWRAEPRSELLSNLGYHRLCISTDGGFGKTKAASQVQVLRQGVHNGHMVVVVELTHLPENWMSYLGIGNDSLLLESLASNFYKLDLDRRLQGPKPSFSEIESLVLASIRQGQFTLVVDGLDQVDIDSGKKQIRGLKTFLNTYEKIHCVVAGRQSAIHDYWDELISDGTTKGSKWEFVRIREFTEHQKAVFIGQKRMERLYELEAYDLFVPRTLEAIYDLDDERFDRIRTASDVYWQSIDQTMAKDFDKHREAKKIPFTRDEFIDFLGFIAFGLISWKDSPRTDVPRGHFSEFEKFLFDRRARMPHVLISKSDFATFRILLSQVARINSQYINFAFLSSQDIADLSWKNRTLQDFFAALYLCRASDECDRQWLAERQSVLGTDPESRDLHVDINYVWRHVCEMPSVAWNADQLDDNDRQLSCIAALFRRGDSTRPTELMFRAWPNLLRRTGYLKKVDWSEADLEQATIDAQRTIAKQVQVVHDSNLSIASPSQPADRMLFDFLSDYQVMRLAGDERSKVIEDDFENQLRSCDSFAGKEFSFGYQYFEFNPKRRMRLTRSFEICAYQVTNRFYALFDEHHQTCFRDYSEHSPYQRGAAIYKNWYSAMMFAIWCHGTLATDFEWEYACRAGFVNDDGSQPKFYFGDDDSRLLDHAWIKKNSLEKSEAERTEIGRERVPHAHVVGQKLPNKFVLYDMLGNVAEWCSNCFDDENRILRGESFRGDAVHVHCSTWEPAGPSTGESSYGVRVSRAATARLFPYSFADLGSQDGPWEFIPPEKRHWEFNQPGFLSDFKTPGGY